MDVPRLLIELAAGFLAGVFAGMTGAGGGILLVPILVFLGLPPLAATGTSNVAISVSAASGTWANTRKYDLPWRQVIILALPAMALAPFGVLLAERISPQVLLLAFAGFNVVAIGLLQLKLRVAARAPAGTEEAAAGVSVEVGAHEAPATDGPAEDARPPAGQLVPAVATGAGGGLLAGLFGVGGGLIMVPLQVLLLGTRIRMASRISLGVVLFSSLSAVITHQISGSDLQWATGFTIALAGLVGAPLGARLLHRFSDRQSTRLIQITMALVAVSFIWRALAPA